MSELNPLYATSADTTPSLIKSAPPVMISFFNEGKQVGILDKNAEGKLYFEGDFEQSARVLFEEVCRLYNERG